VGAEEAREIFEAERPKMNMFELGMWPSTMREKSEDLAQDGDWGEPVYKAFGSEFYFDTNLPAKMLMPVVQNLRAGKWKINE
jgi:hypothetical protein